MLWFQDKTCAVCLSLLALCSALLAPASVLKQKASRGEWSVLCRGKAPSPSSQSGHFKEQAGHCEVCALPALGAPPARIEWPVRVAAALEHEAVAAAAMGPGGPQGWHIRGPPSAS